MTEQLMKLQHKMKKKLDEYRYEHTLGVMYTAGALAMCHGIDLDEALLAGLLHDCAKCYSDEKKLELCEKYGVVLTDVEQKNTALIHAKLGAVLAKEKYGADASVCRAIRSHTTGEPGMDKLQQIIFIADYIEPHRDHSPALGQIRQAAFCDLDEACRMILTDTLNYLSGSERSIDPMTRETCEYYEKVRTSNGREC
jgi:predicted HD superfamily hydrolase involved in NAD metabolism